jgi:hypothetical protein
VPLTVNYCVVGNSKPLGKSGNDLVSGADACEAREDFFEREAVLFRILCRAGILDNHEGKAEACALARSGLDACVGGDAGEDNGVDAACFELLLKIGAGEGSPMAFGDENVTWLEAGRWSNLRGGCRQRFVAPIVRLIDMKRHEVIEVDADINDWGAVSAEYFGEFFGVFDDLHGGIRRGVHAKDGILQIDENERSLLVGELKFRHEILVWGKRV